MTKSLHQKPPAYDEVVGNAPLAAPNRLLTAEELDVLWLLVELIEEVWFTLRRANSLKPQWLDYIQATVEVHPSLLGEYENVVNVHAELMVTTPERVTELLLLRPAPALSAASTRLDHAKSFVVDRFIKCYVMLGGFQEFGGRNYNGFMGGSRFADTAPIRVGRRK